MYYFMKKLRDFLLNYLWIFLLFLAVIFILLQILGINLSRIPGDLGDARLNYYILEHFFQSVRNNYSFWNAPFFYPFPLTVAFSDSHLGSAPIYFIFRFLDFSIESSFQFWFIVGFVINYFVSCSVLIKLKFKPLAAAVGGFFFACGLPMLAKEGHAQLLYRFCVPIASYILWSFSNNPRLYKISILSLLVVWQFSFTFYIGYFLILLLGAMIFVIPFYLSKINFISISTFWFKKLKNSWLSALNWEKIISLLGIVVSILLLFCFIYPYFQVTIIYGFNRSVSEIMTLLPRLHSYLLADMSLIWKSNSTFFTSIPMRQEHQLFPGLSVVLLIFLGLIGKRKSNNFTFASVNLLSFFLLFILTLNIHGFSLYRYLADIPGINSMRVVTRIQLVLMWPISILISEVLDSFLERKGIGLVNKLIVIFLSVLLLVESISFNHYTISKKEAQNRIIKLENTIKEEKLVIEEDSILLLGPFDGDPWYVTEIDAMLLAQKLGIATLNGYSGNIPHGIAITDDCNQISQRILSFMEFEDIENPDYYQDILKRVIILNLEGCEIY